LQKRKEGISEGVMDDESGEKMEEVPLKGLGDYTRI